MNLRRINPQPWRTRFGTREHRPVQVCESCRQDWPCDEERERAERMRRIAEITETFVAARRKQ